MKEEKSRMENSRDYDNISYTMKKPPWQVTVVFMLKFILDI